MVLTREQLLKMDKLDIIDYAESLGNLKEQMDGLEKKIDEYAGELELVKNSKKLLKEHSDKVVGRVVSLEKELTRTSQYTVNRQFEFHRVPTSIADEELSEKVCQEQEQEQEQIPFPTNAQNCKNCPNAITTDHD